MKKLFIAVLLLASFSVTSFAGDKIKLGIKASPVISFASVKDKDTKDGYSFSAEGSALRFVVGPFVDFAINDNVYFSMGLWYSPRTVKISRRYPVPMVGAPLDLFGNIQTTTVGGTSQYNLQYLMVPLYFKFYTNEITTGMRIYFNVGGNVDFKIAEKNVSDNDPAGMKAEAVSEKQQLFSFIDAGLMVGTGVEYQLGDITTIFAGINYNRGLTNIVNPLLDYNGMKPYKMVNVKNQLIGIDLGVKF